MASYLVETYYFWRPNDAIQRADTGAARELTREGTPVRYLRSSADAVRIAAERTALPFERDAEAVTQQREELR